MHDESMEYRLYKLENWTICHEGDNWIEVNQWRRIVRLNWNDSDLSWVNWEGITAWNRMIEKEFVLL